MKKRTQKKSLINCFHKYSSLLFPHVLSLFFVIAFVLIVSVKVHGQTIPVLGFREKQLRLQQLANDSVSSSFSNRPMNLKYYELHMRHPKLKGMWGKALPETAHQYSFLKVGVYDPVFKNTYNTKIPYGENNGAAWYGRGLTSEFHGGFYATSKYVTITFRPDIVYQQNRSFKVPRFVPRDSNGKIEYGAEAIGFIIDHPFRFGPKPYWTFDWGESSLRLHYKNVAVGYSTEPLWWGPGVRYALVMSNNAPGVKHLFIKSRSPVKLPLNIGKVEFNVIWGWPKDSKYFIQSKSPSRLKKLKNDTRNRFMSGMNIVFSPSILPHLYLGLMRVFHQYIPKSGLHAADFLDLFQAFQKKNRSKEIGNYGNDVKNQLASVYLRWVFPKSHAVIYGEYYKEDHNWDLRDLLMEPDHNRAYTIGFQKLILSNWIDFFKINLEINSLEPNLTEVVRPQAYYYTHYLITEGHTNEGQILGAAIGPGSQSQFLGVDGYFDKGKIGLFVQRVVDNNLFYYEWNMKNIAPNDPITYRDWWNHWVKLNIGVEGLYKTRHMLLFGKMVWDKNYNYGRYDIGQKRSTKYDLLNMQFQLGVQYFFGRY